MVMSAKLRGRRRWIWGTHIGHKILLQRSAVCSKKKIQRNDMGEKAGPWERCGEELSAGQWGAGEDRIRHGVGNQFLQPLPGDKKAEL